jgi:hypothetical protein
MPKLSKAKRAVPLDAEGSDLWGRPPAPLARCGCCDQHAEPYQGRFCWMCVTTGRVSAEEVAASDRKGCAKCHAVLPLDRFGRNGRGYNAYCRGCQRASAAANYHRRKARPAGATP